MEQRTRVLLGLGFLLAVAVTGALGVTLLSGEPSLGATWVRTPPDSADDNRHAPAIGTVDGQSLVYASLNGPGQGSPCQLETLAADTGEFVWRYRVPARNCSGGAVGEPTVAVWNGRPSAFVATAEHALLDLHPTTGAVRARYPLSAPGHTPPVVADLAPGDGDELVVADTSGTVHVFSPEESPVWRARLGSSVRARPVIGNLSGGGEPQVAVGTIDGRLVVLDRNGSPVRRIDAPFDGAITRLTSGELDGDPAMELVVSTVGGQVVVLDGATGAVEWARSFAPAAAVRAIGDADGDGRPEVFATTADGVVRSLSADTGRTVWEREVPPGEGGAIPPSPVYGDVTGDGVGELVVATNGGHVVVLEAASGTRIADHDRGGAIRGRPTLAEVDSDRRLELFVTYAGGVVVRLDYQA